MGKIAVEGATGELLQLRTFRCWRTILRNFCSATWRSSGNSGRDPSRSNSRSCRAYWHSTKTLMAFAWSAKSAGCIG
jgi:hypothetical protein